MTVRHGQAISRPPHPGDSTRPAPWQADELRASRRGLVVLSGSGRPVWWTGRVAIGLRYEPDARPPLTGTASVLA